MKTITTMKSDEARIQWRDLLDSAHAGDEIVIERYNKPMAVVVNYAEWQRMKQQRLAKLDQRLADMKAGNYISEEEYEAGLKERGLA